MAKTLIGVDIGTNAVKMAVCAGGRVLQTAVETLPENMVSGGRIVSPDSMSQFLREMRKNHHISARNAAVVLPETDVFCRRLTLPAMTEDQLRLNLPYEFRDYIAHEKEKYFYDYAVVDIIDDETGIPVSLDLMAAAVLKSTVADYFQLFKRAGMRLKVAVPMEMAYTNLLAAHERAHPAQEGDSPREYCLLDLGHTAIRTHVFTGSAFEVTKVMDIGCALLDTAIAEHFHVDEHIARTYKLTNYQDSQELDSCVSLYSTVAIEIMKAINFYRYNKPETEITEAYYFGGGAHIDSLITAVSATIGLHMQPIDALLPHVEKGAPDTLLCALAIGAAQQ